MDETFKKAHKAPTEFKLKDWKEILNRSRKQIAKDNLGIVSAGVAFYAFLGIFPLLAAFVALYGLISSPSDVMLIIEPMKGVIPGEIISIIKEQLTRLSSEIRLASWAAIISLLAAFWTGSKALRGMMSALNIAYDEEETRNFFKKYGIAFLLTLGGIITGAVSIFLIAGIPALNNFLEFEGTFETLLLGLRWALLAIILISASSILYRFAPDRKAVKWRWITPGSTLATIVWLAASGLFSAYVSNFANYNKTYGSLGAIAIMLLWLSLSSFIFVLGAELDAEMERQGGINKKDDKKKQVM